MVSAFAMAVALSGPPQKVESEAAMATIQRLTAAALARTGSTAEERALLAAMKETLQQLLIYVEKCDQVMRGGHWTSQDVFNYLQVTRDLVDAGCQLCVLPEERLCWQAAGLKLAYAHYQYMRGRLAVAKDPPAQLNSCRAQFELFKAQYDHTLKECKPMPR
jgi:hypothetical protein